MSIGRSDLLPADGEVTGLLALMLMTEVRTYAEDVRAVVTAELGGPAVALGVVDQLVDAYDAAIGLAVNPAERRHLQRRRDSLASL